MINNTIEFKCKVITPMFLHGADNETPELRAPSIKGAMRFWWRACNGHLSLVDLKKAEDAIFGSTNGRSCFGIRVEVEGSVGLIPFKDGAKVVAHKRLIKLEDIELKSYDENEKPQKGKSKKIQKKVKSRSNNFKSAGWDKGSFFNVKLMLYKSCEKYGFGLEQLKSLFRVVSYLGGLGKRSRRGNGGFKIIGEEHHIDWERLTSDLNNIVNRISFLQEGSNINNIIKKTNRNDVPSIISIEKIDTRIPLDKNTTLDKTARFAISESTHIIKKQSISRGNEIYNEKKDYEHFIGSGAPRLASTVSFSINVNNEDRFEIVAITLYVIRDERNFYQTKQNKPVKAKYIGKNEVSTLQKKLIQEVKNQLTKNDSKRK